MIWKLTDECWWGDQLIGNDQLEGAKIIIAVADNLDIDPNRYDVPFYRIPLADNADIDPRKIILALRAMEACAETGFVPFLLMCRAGQSRSPAFAALWLSAKERIPYGEAMKRVLAIRGDCFPHERTWRQLEEFRKGLG